MGQYDSVTLYRIRRLLAELASKKGRGTELISLYIPTKRPIYDILNVLKDEYGTASNIKNDATRNNVQNALTKVMQRLKLYRKTPENGLIIFCGSLPIEGSTIDEEIKLYEIIPPKPINIFLYRCDDHFHIEILKDMLREEDEIGVISIDTSEAGLGIISGDRVSIVKVLTSGVGGKHRQGGQSARRFERLRETEINEFFRRVAKYACKAFLEDHKVKRLVISGPGMTKEDFYKNEYLDYRLQKAVIGLVDTSYAGEEGIRETIQRGRELLQDVRFIEERELIEKFLYEASRSDGLAVYGLEPVIQAIKEGSVGTILVLDDIGYYHLLYRCKYCEFEGEKMVKKHDLFTEKAVIEASNCPSCGRNDWNFMEEDLIDYLYDKALELGATVEVISSKTEHGKMFKNFGGIGGMLRYKIQRARSTR